MKILTIIHRNNLNGGANLQFIKLKQEFEKKCHQNSIFFLDKFRNVKNPFFRFILLIRNFAKISYDFDMIFLADPIITAGFFLIAQFIKKFNAQIPLNKRMVVVMRIGSVFDSFYSARLLKKIFPDLSILKNKMFKVLKKIIQHIALLSFKNVNLVIFNSKFLLNLYTHISNTSKIVVYNCVNQIFFKNRGISANNNWEKKQIDSKKLKLVYIGRIEPRKSIESLIFIMKNMKNLKISLDIYGKLNFSDKYLKALLKLKKDNSLDDYVFFKNYIQNSHLPNILRNYDILLFPTNDKYFPITEGLPNVILEALASGLIVGARSVAGVPEIINASNGFLVKDDLNGFIKGIKEIIFKPEIIPKLKKYNLEYSKKFKANQIANKYLICFKKCQLHKNLI